MDDSNQAPALLGLSNPPALSPMFAQFTVIARDCDLSALSRVVTTTTSILFWHSPLSSDKQLQW